MSKPAPVVGSREWATEWMRGTLSPVVAVLSSADVEIVCQKNKLSFCDLLLPFSQLTTEVSIKDPANTTSSLSVRNLRVDFRDLRRDGFLLANSVLPSVLSEAVKDAARDIPKAEGVGPPWYEAFRDSFLHWMEPVEHEFLRHYLACVLVVSTNHTDPLDQLTKLSQSQHAQQHTGQSAPSLPDVIGGPSFAATPKWFVPNIFKYHVLVHDVASGDDKKAETVYQSMKMSYGAHACHLLRFNSAEPSTNPQTAPDPWRSLLEAKYRGLSCGIKLAKKTALIETGTIPSTGEVMLESVDQSQSLVPNGQSPSEEPTVFTETDSLSSPAHQPAVRAFRSESIPNALSTNDLSSLALNSPIGDADVTPCGPGGWPSIEDLHMTEARWRESKEPMGQCLTASDRDRIKIFVQEFASRGLLGFVERQMRLLNDQVVSRRGLHKSIFGKLLGRGAAPGPVPPQGSNSASASVTYTQESGEMQMRRLADLSFLFQHYQKAFDLYQTLKREFANDGAWFYHAGALEMAALSAFLMGPIQFSRVYPHHYMDNAITTYMNTCGRPMQAVRAALLSSEILGGLDMYSETATLYIRMTSGDSDLCSALFLEQASRAFKRVKMERKYALHLILAGHRYNKAGDKGLALACYLLACEVYRDKHWSLAEDHINYTVGHLSQALSNSEQARSACTNLLHVNSLQYPSQQDNFLRDYLRILKSKSDDPLDGNKDSVPDFVLPFIDSQNVQVHYGGTPEDCDRFVNEPSENSPSNAVQNVGKSTWATLEEGCWQRLTSTPVVRQSSPSSTTPSFAMSIPVGNRKTDNSRSIEVPSGETFSLVLPVSNPMNVPLAILESRLEWHIADNPTQHCGFDSQTSTDTVLGPEADGVLSLSLKIGGDPNTEEYFRGKRITVTGVRFKMGPCTNIGTVEEPQYVPDGSLVTEGRISLNVRGKRLNREKEHRMNIMHGSDFRLQPTIGPSLPLIRCELMPRSIGGTFDDNSTLNVVSGEIIPFRLRVTNCSISASVLQNLVVAVSPDPSVCLTTTSYSNRPDDNISNSLIPAQKMSNGVTVHELVDGGQQSTDTLSPGQVREWVLWVRSPSLDFEHQGEKNLKLLIFYRGSGSYSIRHRILRRRIRLRTHASLVLKSQCTPTGLTSAGPSTALKNALVCLKCENGNRPNDDYISEIEIMRLTLLSSGNSRWKLCELISPRKEIKMNPSEEENVCFLLEEERTLPDMSGEVTTSEEWLTPEIPDIQGNPGHLSREIVPWPPAVQLMKIHSAPKPEQHHTKNSKNEHSRPSPPKCTAIIKAAVLFKAHIVDAEGSVRTIWGEQWCEISVSGAFGANPNTQTPILMQSPGIDAPPIADFSRLSRSLTVNAEDEMLDLRDFVQCHLNLHSSVVRHDFTKERLCYCPVYAQISYGAGYAHPIAADIHCYTGGGDDAKHYARGSCPPVVWVGKTLWSFSQLTVGSSEPIQLTACIPKAGVFDVSSLRVTVTDLKTRKEAIITVASKFITVLG